MRCERGKLLALFFFLLLLEDRGDLKRAYGGGYILYENEFFDALIIMPKIVVITTQCRRTLTTVKRKSLTYGFFQCTICQKQQTVSRELKIRRAAKRFDELLKRCLKIR